jgi:hypothetical protein
MKWLFNTIYLFLILVSCSSSDSVENFGPGVIHFEDNYSQRLSFYNTPDSLSRIVFYVDIIFEDSVKKVQSSLNRKKDSLDFFPLYKGVSSLTLQIVDMKGNWYKVYTDNHKAVGHWVYVDDRSYESWRSFWPTVKRVVDRADDICLRENPSDNAKAFDFSSQRLCLNVVEVQGAWLKVRNTPDSCPDSYVIQEEFEGFLRWHSDGEILVNFLL